MARVIRKRASRWITGWMGWAMIAASACHNGSPTTERVEVASSPSGDRVDHDPPEARAAGRQQTAPGDSRAIADEREASAQASPTLHDALAYDDADPLGELEKADVLDGPKGSDDAADGVSAGPCRALSPPQRLWRTPAQLAVTVAGREFVVAGYASKPSAGGASEDKAGEAAAGGEQVFVMRMSERGLPQPLRTLSIDPPHPGERKAAPGLSAQDADHVTLAVIDGAGQLGIQTVALSSPRSPLRLRTVTRGADSRFAPAVSHIDAGVLVAYTEGSTPMRTHVALVPVDDKPPTITNVTPPQVGAAAPSFVRGAYPPQLYAVDARDGMSPLLKIAITPQGVPLMGDIVVPVGMVASPPQLASARASFGTLLAYVGIGSAATTAVGVIEVGAKPGAPSALVKGTAYGPLSVSAASAPDAVYFAADAPKAPTKRPPREIHLIRIDEHGDRETTVVQGPGGDAYGAAIARNGVGTVALVFSSPSGAYVARFQCR